MKECLNQVGQVAEFSYLIVPIILITKAQVKAILRRDNNKCHFPDEHNCRGKISVHHIKDKEDVPEDLITVCRIAHWEFLHNGAEEKDVVRWQKDLKTMAVNNTKKAIKKGWQFP